MVRNTLSLLLDELDNYICDSNLVDSLSNK